ncbi:hypothetical protein F4823DRAFT_41262 [Ustulina deusta]|nr:hypothetical protein F4823DRAFT_41262 [Ustulina deusta]
MPFLEHFSFVIMGYARNCLPRYIGSVFLISMMLIFPLPQSSCDASETTAQEYTWNPKPTVPPYMASAGDETISLARSLSLYFWIFPLAVLGYSSIQKTCLGTRWPERLVLTQSWICRFPSVSPSSSSSSSPWPSTATTPSSPEAAATGTALPAFTNPSPPVVRTPLCGTTKAATASPWRSSGTPTTLTSWTPPSWNTQFSTSRGWMFSPPRMTAGTRGQRPAIPRNAPHRACLLALPGCFGSVSLSEPP